MKDFKINKGVELMLRGERPKEDIKPDKGFFISKAFSLLKRKVYFNLELWWVEEKN
jgi:hypothetical protein